MLGSNEAKMAQNGPKTATGDDEDRKSKMFKIYRKIQVGMALEGSKKGPSAQQVEIKLSQDGPRSAQDGSQRAPKFDPQSFPRSKPKKIVPAPISTVELAPFWAPLGAHIGPMLGPGGSSEDS